MLSSYLSSSWSSSLNAVPFTLSSETGELLYDTERVRTYTSAFFTTVTIMALIVGLVTYVLERHLLPAIGRRLLSAEKWRNTDERVRFTENVSELLHHTFSFVAGVQIIITFFSCWSEDYFACNTLCNPRDITMWFSTSLVPLTGHDVITVLYVYQLAHYMYGMVDLVAVKKHKKDFSWMLLHHVATILLISVSSYSCLRHSGIGIMVFFDAADIFIKFIHIGRSMNSDILVKTSYVFLVPVFIIPRLIMLPYLLRMHILYAAPHLPYEEYLWYALGLITLCDMVWAYIILKVGWRALHGEAIDDPRTKNTEKQD